MSSWINENVVSENMSPLTGILLKRAVNRSIRPESNKQERREERERERKKKLSILAFFYIADVCQEKVTH